MKLNSFATAFFSGFLAVTALSTTALAGPTYTFGVSEGTQAADVGLITITQSSANSVIVNVNLQSGYGFLNTGGPHTPFAFQLAGSGTLSVSFSSPLNGVYPDGTFSLNTAGGSNTPYGSFNVAIDSSAGNGSGKAFYNDLVFTLTRTGTLDTSDFVQNASGAYFSADLTDGSSTGAQAWKGRTTLDVPPPNTVPEPLTLALFGAGLAGLAATRRRRKA